MSLFQSDSKTLSENDLNLISEKNYKKSSTTPAEVLDHNVRDR